MTAPLVGRLRGAARRLRSRFEHRVLILLYHRVAEPLLDPWGLSVAADYFDEHLAVMRRTAPTMRLADVPDALLAGRLPRRSIVVTFDDGYADNLYRAKPALLRHGVPATVFLTTGALGGTHEFWWDELERLLLHPGVVPATLRLDLAAERFVWDLGEWASYGEATARRHRRWRAYEAAPTGRHALYYALWERLLPLPRDEQQRILAQLRAWAGVESTRRETHRALSPAEAARLADGGLVELGAHTRTHPALAALPATAQREEIGRSKGDVETISGHSTTTFSYPYGRRSDYGAETLALVHDAGFACACTNVAGVVGPTTDPFRLPRVQVQNWSGEEFARRLARWFLD